MEDDSSSAKQNRSQSQLDAVIATVKCGHSAATISVPCNIAQDRTSFVVGLQKMKQLLNDKLTDLVYQQSAARVALKTQTSSSCGDEKVPRYNTAKGLILLNTLKFALGVVWYTN
jgi:hypothetical protein